MFERRHRKNRSNYRNKEKTKQVQLSIRRKVS